MSPLLTVAYAGTRVRATSRRFIGAQHHADEPHATGFAVGAGLLIVGFEFEYSNTADDVSTGAPSLKTGMGNVLLQTPVAIFGFQPYFTTGAGFYREALGRAHGHGVRVRTPAAA